MFTSSTDVTNEYNHGGGMNTNIFTNTSSPLQPPPLPDTVKYKPPLSSESGPGEVFKERPFDPNITNTTNLGITPITHPTSNNCTTPTYKTDSVNTSNSSNNEGVKRVQSCLPDLDWRSLTDPNNVGVLQSATEAMLQHFQRGQGRGRTSNPKKRVKRPTKRPNNKQKKKTNRRTPKKSTIKKKKSPNRSKGRKSR